jgi:hypothetical protein
MSDLPLREALARSQAELNPSGQWPVRIAEIASALGIALQIRTASGNEIADLEIGDNPVITLYRRSKRRRELDGNERFSVAHELGHWILWRRARAVPRRASEYWLHEALCNQFAANLLVPQLHLRRAVEELREQKIRSVFFPTTIARAANVSWSVAARAITTIYPTLGYLKLVAHSSSRLLVHTSSVSRGLGCFMGERALIRDKQLLDATLELAPGARQTARLSFEAGALQVRDAPCLIMREYSSARPTFIVAMSLSESIVTPNGTTGNEKSRGRRHSPASNLTKAA